LGQDVGQPGKEGGLLGVALLYAAQGAAQMPVGGMDDSQGSGLMLRRFWEGGDNRLSIWIAGNGAP
jgi:hypothetical protein